MKVPKPERRKLKLAAKQVCDVRVWTPKMREIIISMNRRFCYRVQLNSWRELRRHGYSCEHCAEGCAMG